MHCNVLPWFLCFQNFYKAIYWSIMKKTEFTDRSKDNYFSFSHFLIKRGAKTLWLEDMMLLFSKVFRVFENIVMWLLRCYAYKGVCLNIWQHKYWWNRNRRSIKACTILTSLHLWSVPAQSHSPDLSYWWWSDQQELSACNKTRPAFRPIHKHL